MSIDTGRLSMHELRELKDEFCRKRYGKTTRNMEKKVLKLDDDLQKKFRATRW